MGTWQIMTVKNLKTGEVDSVFKRRLLWTQYTTTQWTYLYMDTGRVGRNPAESARLSAEARRKENYDKMWNEAGQWRFWGSGGTYWLDGDRMFYANLISIEPYQLHLGGVEKIIYVNDTAYAYQSTPDKDGVVREYAHRRLDHGGAAEGRTATGASAPNLIIGNWQVMSRRNLKTGETENVAQRRVNWFHVTQNHWTYVWMTKDRRNVTPDELAKLPPAQQSQERYAKIWDRAGQPVFWASAGTYHLDGGKFIVEPRVMSIEPWMIGVEGVEPITTLDRETYTYQSAPDSSGAVWETVHRRIDW
ncbi:MAG: hypothetical protein HY700_20725 [Gemmatimonadetes bacterium]|nr:hypothetical protein [Gemmatimonadota bacterium]